MALTGRRTAKFPAVPASERRISPVGQRHLLLGLVRYSVDVKSDLQTV